MISQEDRELIRKFEDIMRKGRYCNGRQLQTVYNRVFDVTMAATSCGSCLRARTQKLVAALNKEEADEAKEAASKAADTNERGEKGETESVPLETIKKKRGRPKKEE